MGCVNSRHPNSFQVMNVDDMGNLIAPGCLVVTDLDIILYQHGKQTVKWPLRCLRRYGYDDEIFSFESGRRCSTGPGIYAFKCRRAAKLFNLVQSNIQVCTNGGDDTISRDVPTALHPGPTPIRATISSEPNYLDPMPPRSNGRIAPRFPQVQQNGRLNSIGSSSGPMSPQGTMGSPSPPPMLPPPPPTPYLNPSLLYVNEEVLSTIMTVELEHNNNKSLSRTIQRSCTMSSTTSDSGLVASEHTSGQTNQEQVQSRLPCLPAPPSYMNVDISSDASPLSPSHSTCESTPVREEASEALDVAGHAYMNINPGQENVETIAIKNRPPLLPPLQLDWEEGSRHCYANLEISEVECLRKRFSTASGAEKSPLPPQTPPSGAIREVSYAVLDLDKKETASSDALPSPPESPNKPQKGYATIDFNKTAALSHSVNPNNVADIDEGSRKTRHNSTIDDLTAPTRHSSSISE